MLAMLPYEGLGLALQLFVHARALRASLALYVHDVGLLGGNRRETLTPWRRVRSGRRKHRLPDISAGVPPLLMGVIICCVDDSEGARRALPVAHGLSVRLGLDLVLLHVEPPTEAPGVSAAAAGQQRLRDEEMRDAQSLLNQLAREAGLGRDVRLRSAIGDAAHRIVEICEEEQAALVVLGSRGRGGVAAALLGSVSSHVAARAPCPCLIVPPDARQPFST